MVVAAIGIPIALVAIYLGKIPFFLLIVIFSNLALVEYFNLAKEKKFRPHTANAVLFSISLEIIFMLQFSRLIEASPFMVAILIFLGFILVTFIIELFSNSSESAIANVSITIAGTAYVIFFFLSLYILREFDSFLNIFTRNAMILDVDRNFTLLTEFTKMTNLQWACFIFTLFASIWVCDSAAFFVGKAFGKHKLFERVSPKKTIEGALAGLVFAVITFVVMGSYLLPPFSLFHLAVSGLIVGVMGQTGDLAESMLKRDAGVKDASQLLPGHGGALDRFDSVLFVAPSLFIYYCVILFFNINL